MEGCGNREPIRRSAQSLKRAILTDGKRRCTKRLG
jgi:hypothetical protein